MNSNVTQGSKGTHGQFATPPSPPPHTSPRLPAIHLPACRPAPCCCPLPGLIAKRAWAHGKHSSCLFFFGLSCHSPFRPPAQHSPARIEQMPKNVTAPRTITTVNCGRGWGSTDDTAAGSFLRHFFGLVGMAWGGGGVCVRGFVFVASHSLAEQANSVCVCVRLSVYFYCIYH